MRFVDSAAFAVFLVHRIDELWLLNYICDSSYFMHLCIFYVLVAMKKLSFKYIRKIKSLKPETLNDTQHVACSMSHYGTRVDAMFCFDFCIICIRHIYPSNG